MPQQQNLFPEQAPDTSQEEIASTALQLTSQHGRLSPDQQRFNRLLKRIDNLKSQLAKIETLCDAHRPAYHLTLSPLQERHSNLIRELVLWLHARLQGKGLSAALKRDAKTILCHFSQTLAIEGDEEMRHLHDQYSTESLAQKQQNMCDDMRAMMEDMFDFSPSEDEPLDNIDDLLHASLKQLREADAAEEEQRQQKQRRRKKTSTQVKAEETQQEADSMLRKLFRQLASMLHPDRENNPEKRAHKTELMSEANKAYESRDLVTLLKIQLHMELTTQESIAQLAQEKIASLTVLLKQQIKALENQLHTRRQRALQEFDLMPYDPLTKTTLTRNLKQTEWSLQQAIREMELDLERIQDDQTLKTWLKEQKKLLAQSASTDFFDLFGMR
ncbi:J domain-containing protein [Nitrosomonas halophila]|uniref:DnaJ domain-containing protein n=1 Tax=Nitrosomonas halophila TaxID=44576 RepID=A0A1H3PP85_9PROT|nr:J domain-containing protein [Nitrosomonas halophila]SDZ02219.1 hypothetical protein SAMN05421881_11037 [Nitrosomonas halophila]